MEAMSDSYPRLAARTARFTLGVPRNISVSPDGGTVRFVRTPDGVSRTGQLWEYDVEHGTERLLVDPAALLPSDEEELSAEEKARRERRRESAAGIVGYDVDPTGRWMCFVLSGRLWATQLATGTTRELPASGPVIDPRLDPTGRRIAYASRGSLRVIGVDGSDDRALVSPESATEVWGQAEFIAAEEMDRFRGFWWSPDGTALLIERYDEREVSLWHIGDPQNPDRPAVAQRYPAAGTANADVTLWHVDLDGNRTRIEWDRDAFEYLARVSWNEHGAPVVQVLSRDQRHSQILGVDIASGGSTVLVELRDDAWIDLSATPRFAPGGRLVWCADREDRHRVVVDDRPISDPSWQVRDIVGVFKDSVVATASQEPTEIQVVRFGYDKETVALTGGAAVHNAVIGGPTTVISRAALESSVPELIVHHEQRAAAGRLGVVMQQPPFEPGVELLRLGDRELRAAVLFPREHDGQRLPILMDPYGGPHAQRVMASARMYLEPQWLADQGFCVVVADGRGTGGRGHDWDRSLRDSFAEVTLQDQVDALAAVAERYGNRVDTARVGIMGWSYGGYLAALAVLARPDLFHAAVAGAPVTEWRLYDTCYTERYLGHPAQQPDVYDRNSLLNLAPRLQRPLMLIHGLADDNVVAAHTLRLSSALLAAGRPHTVLPLSGVTHMTPQEDVAENLKHLQVEFLQRHLHP